GYLSGSILYARVFSFVFSEKDITDESPDKNPGTANAFMYGGFLCGVFTLLGDVLKGFFSIYFYMIKTDAPLSFPLAAVMAAPVIGHILPIFFKFRSGKGIATSFGVLLGLLPNFIPLAVLAFFFILFSTLLKITPHYYRTLFTYVISSLTYSIGEHEKFIAIGFLLISAAIIAKLILSREEKEKPKVRTLWMH
ncbi:MAG: glycerol-3-phosphate acyltransferase, partial [Firmicutes bacterium]|nr:glycerol-3-phosphate acyltransferase [Bacillota bacterium]